MDCFTNSNQTWANSSSSIPWIFFVAFHVQGEKGISIEEKKSLPTKHFPTCLGHNWPRAVGSGPRYMICVTRILKFFIGLGPSTNLSPSIFVPISEGEWNSLRLHLQWQTSGLTLLNPVRPGTGLGIRLGWLGLPPAVARDIESIIDQIILNPLEKALDPGTK